MEWFSQPLDPATQFLGIPIFWYTRIAKILQFLAGTIIIIDVLEENRFKELVETTQIRLSRGFLNVANPLIKIGKNIYLLSFYYIYVLFGIEDDALDIDDIVLLEDIIDSASLIASCVVTTSSIITIDRILWSDVWQIAMIAMLTYSLGKSYIFLIIFYSIMQLLSFITFILFQPFYWMSILSSIILDKKQILKRYFITSFFLLITSFIIDLLTS